MEKIRNLRKELSELSIEELNEVQDLMEGGVKPESDEQMMIGEKFESRCNQWREDFSHALSLLAQCEVAIDKEINSREEDFRDSKEYEDAISFLEIYSGTETHPNWEWAQEALEGQMDHVIAELAVQDAKDFDNPECEREWPM